MNRRECLKVLAALGINLALPASAIESASQKNIDSAWQDLQSSSAHGLADHPRIALLRNDVLSLPVDEEYKNLLLHSIELYRDDIINRPVYAREPEKYKNLFLELYRDGIIECPVYEGDVGWSDLEAIQQVTLGDMGMRWFQEQAEIQAKLEREASTNG
jgi:hypothetical protein